MLKPYIVFLQEEQQKTKKKKKSTKKKVIVTVEPSKISQDSSSPDVDSQDGSLTDNEVNTGNVKFPGGPRAMAPGIFLSQKRPSMSSSNNSTNPLSTNNSSMTKGDRMGSADAKGEHQIID